MNLSKSTRVVPRTSCVPNTMLGCEKFFCVNKLYWFLKGNVFLVLESIKTLGLK